MMTAALEGLTRPDGTRPLLIAVTQLTSTDQERMERELLIAAPRWRRWCCSYAANAAAAGLDGVVCSPLEAGSRPRGAAAPTSCTVTPGVRFAGGDAGRSEAGHHPRASARELGSDYIVVGPPHHAGRGPCGGLSPLRKGVCGLMRWNTVLFDLDGTVTDPKEGITSAAAYALRHARSSATMIRTRSRRLSARRCTLIFPALTALQSDEQIGPRHRPLPGVLRPAGLGGEHPLPRHGGLSRRAARCGADAPHRHLEARADGRAHPRTLRPRAVFYRASAARSPATARAPIKPPSSAPRWGGRAIPRAPSWSATAATTSRADTPPGSPSSAYIYGYGGHTELAEAGADAIAANLTELKDILLGS